MKFLEKIGLLLGTGSVLLLMIASNRYWEMIEDRGDKSGENIFFACTINGNIENNWSCRSITEKYSKRYGRTGFYPTVLYNTEVSAEPSKVQLF